VTLAGELYALAERCEQAAGPDGNLDFQLDYVRCDWPSIPPPPNEADWTELADADDLPRAYTASLDAALTLVPNGHDWLVRSEEPRGAMANVSRKDATNITQLDVEFDDGSAFAQGHRYGDGANGALALCAAALRARAAQGMPREARRREGGSGPSGLASPVRDSECAQATSPNLSQGDTP
jgi:hypothetical protein